MSYQMKCWGPGWGRHLSLSCREGWGGHNQHMMSYKWCGHMGVNRRRGQSQICGDQDIGLRFEDSFGCWMQFINKRRLHELKSFIWCICTASEIERETSFFTISIHTMWIGKLSLWSLRSPPSLQPIPGPRIGWMEPKSLCRIIAFVFILAPAHSTRERILS